MSDPREDVFAAVASALEAIRLSNGYTVDVDKVYRVDLLADQMPSTVRRALLVLESLTPESWKFLEASNHGGFDAVAQITIAGICRGGSVDIKSSDRATETNELLMATVKALMTDETFDGTAADSLIMNPVVFIDTDRAEGLFNLTLRVHYVFGYGDL